MSISRRGFLKRTLAGITALSLTHEIPLIAAELGPALSPLPEHFMRLVRIGPKGPEQIDWLDQRPGDIIRCLTFTDEKLVQYEAYRVSEPGLRPDHPDSTPGCPVVTLDDATYQKIDLLDVHTKIQMAVKDRLFPEGTILAPDDPHCQLLFGEEAYKGG